MAGNLPTSNGIPVLPTFFPIDTSGISDVSNVPIFNTMRGDIVPALIDWIPTSPTYLQILNHPTPFYIFCAAKIVNTANAYNTLPKTTNTDGIPITPEAYIQFGMTQGNSDIFPATNAQGDNIARKNQFTLTNFSKAFTSGVFTDNPDASAGLLVPVYCYQDPIPYNTDDENANQPAFVFFRADVFWDTSIDSNPFNSINQIPDKPISYQSINFPSPLGKTIDKFFYLASYYSLQTSDRFQTGTWSQFMPSVLIAAINSPVTGNNYFANGPAAAIVSISFNDPYVKPIYPLTGQAYNYNPVNILRSSSIYTVMFMNQRFDPISPVVPGGKANDIQGYQPYETDYNTQDTVRRNYGYPLNFIYQVGNDTYSTTQQFNTYYQGDNINVNNNFLGTVVQWGTNPQAGSNGWNLASISTNFQDFNYNFATINDQGLNGLYYRCDCTDARNNYCGYAPLFGKPNGIFISGTTIEAANSHYYFDACSNIHLGTYNFSMFQFVPINFFTPPRLGTVPNITSPQDQPPPPPLPPPVPPIPYQGEVAITGEIGVPATSGPGPVGMTGTYVPVYVPGPTGSGPYAISFPFNTQTGTTGMVNPWPTASEPSNRINNIDLTDALAGWIANPLEYECPKNISSQKYCGFQDYYHSLLGYFYEKPQDLPPTADCGTYYVPPLYNAVTSTIQYPTNGCVGPNSVCVPNYDYLNNTQDPSKRPFYCQDSNQAVPYPESTNGFNTTNAYPILNFNDTFNSISYMPIPPTSDRIIQDQNIAQTCTPITWENLYTYVNVTPNQTVPSDSLTFAPVQFVPKLNSVNPQTSKPNPKGDSGWYIVLVIIALIVFVFAIVFFIYYSAKSKNKDMYNPNNFMHYNRVV